MIKWFQFDIKLTFRSYEFRTVHGSSVVVSKSDLYNDGSLVMQE